MEIENRWPFAYGLESGIVAASIREAVANGAAALAQTRHGLAENGAAVLACPYMCVGVKSFNAS